MNDTNELIGLGVIDDDHDKIQVACGAILILIGILGGFGNGVFLMSMNKFRVLIVPANMLLFNLALGDFLMVISQNPFSGISGIMNRWQFGEIGCQVYGFFGFFSGTVMIGSMTVIAMYRYYVTKHAYENINVTFKNTLLTMVGVWLFALFWASMPLLGWSRYGLEPSLTACTIDWRHNDASYKSFLISYCLFGFIVPFFVQIVCYYKAIKIMKENNKNLSKKLEDNRNKVKLPFIWALNSSANKMGMILVASFLVAWTPYAILCMWTVFAEPSTVPYWLTLWPPIAAKSFTVVNPIVFYVSNPRLRRAMKLTVTKCFQNYPLDLPVDAENL